MPSLAERLRFLVSPRFRAEHPLVPVVRLSGAIGVSTGLRQGLSFQGVASALEKAFTAPGARAVALLINSPGGSPTQSHLIFRRIRLLAEEKKLPVYAFCEDAAASGGYMIACAADEIFADDNSIVGSIGVVSGGFGFHELINRYGVERRLYTTGENKAILDPFRPEREEDIVHLKALQQEVHESFIALVRRRRGDVLADAPDLFTGLFWTGATSRDLGLIDRIGDIRSTLRERFGDKVRMRLVGGPRSLFSRRQGVGVEIGAGLTQGWADEAIGALEQRALWARYGL